MDSRVLDIDTATRRTVDMTDQVGDFCREREGRVVQRLRAARHRGPGHHRERRRLRRRSGHGRPLLGTWQSVVLVDLNRDNPRRSVRLSFLAAR